jgi:hypothetical protein
MNKQFLCSAGVTLALTILAGLAADTGMKGMCSALALSAVGAFGVAMFTWGTPDA